MLLEMAAREGAKDYGKTHASETRICMFLADGNADQASRASHTGRFQSSLILRTTVATQTTMAAITKKPSGRIMNGESQMEESEMASR